MTYPALRFTHRLLSGLMFAALTVGAAQAALADTTLKVGDQQLQTRGVLEASGQLKNVPYQIEWFNFPAAQPLGEALNAGAIDVGGLGDAPLIFAYAAGARVRAVAATRSAPVDLAIIVPDGSPIRSAADLKGKRIATTRGSIGHYLAIATLERAGIKQSDVSLRFMQPAAAKAAAHFRHRLAAGFAQRLAILAQAHALFAAGLGGGSSLAEAVQFGASLLIWGVFVRTVRVWHITWSVNSAAHAGSFRLPFGCAFDGFNASMTCTPMSLDKQ